MNSVWKQSSFLLGAVLVGVGVGLYIPSYTNMPPVLVAIILTAILTFVCAVPANTSPAVLVSVLSGCSATIAFRDLTTTTVSFIILIVIFYLALILSIQLNLVNGKFHDLLHNFKFIYLVNIALWAILLLSLTSRNSGIVVTAILIAILLITTIVYLTSFFIIASSEFDKTVNTDSDEVFAFYLLSGFITTIAVELAINILKILSID